MCVCVCVCVCALLCVFVSVCKKTFWFYRADTAVSVFTFVAISVLGFYSSISSHVTICTFVIRISKLGIFLFYL